MEMGSFSHTLSIDRIHSICSRDLCISECVARVIKGMT